ncbi:prepilin-type N-terminal cleavage/methylation domain-containing protein [Bacillus tianshenii]|uniref:Prepilin-type N-terminal cleavage/methylation domain-containing protein n=1 Tax=Sutcliffiella tianshenii TaxID=1463404 RepID=A0ABS2P164_9BACI|nr:prepilin-type N-terminal cleavage/methylation domain-containing protein [Bacillus tianshenii]MBM7620468.1 prepilin-type N-terminal cleavage/methylation domain-containing protein [Bacillus tianshenii]
MNLFAKVFRDERGVTLLELLAVLVISSIILGTMYSSFIMGVNLYKKIGIESQLRDEADIILATMLNDLNRIQPEAILYNSDESYIELYSVKTLIKNDYYYKNEDLLDIIQNSASIQFVLKPKANDNTKYDLYKTYFDPTVKQVKINSDSVYLMPINEGGNIMSYECTNKKVSLSNIEKVCDSGVITTKFKLGHLEYSETDNKLFVEPLEFISEFGY